MKIFNTIFRFFSKNYLFLIICIFGIYGVFGFLSLQLNFNNDISKTFSEQKNFEELNAILKRKNLSNQIIFSAEFPEETSLEAKIEILNLYASKIESETENKIQNLSFRDTNGIDFYFNYFHENLPHFFSSELEEYLKSIQSEDSIYSVLQKNYKILSGDGGFIFRNILISDPLHLSSKILASSVENLPQKQIDQETGFYQDKSGNPLIRGEFNFDFLDSDISQKIVSKIDDVNKSFEDKYGVKIRYFSGFLITLGNSKTIASDTKLTLSIGVGFILLLLIVYYQSLLIPILFVIPGFFGVVFALGSIYIIQGEISLIAIGTGAVALGIVLDFSFHFFTHFKKTKDLEVTLNDVSTPLLIGSLTTIMAFFALIFTSSPILKDFGLFTSLSLVGSILFILLFFPALLSKIPIQFKRQAKFHFSLPKKVKLYSAIFFVGAAIYFIPDVSKVEFDEDLKNLNYQSAELLELEKELNLIEPKETARIFAISKHQNANTSLEAYEKAYQLLNQKREEGKVKTFVNFSPFHPSIKTQNENANRWSSFFNSEHNSLIQKIKYKSDSVGFNSEIFTSFYNKISIQPNLFQENPRLMAQFKSLIDSTDGYSYLSIIDVPRDNLTEIKSELRALKHIGVIDRGEISQNMVQSVQDDFNYILIFSSLIVFLTLLIMYGRIELALVTFLPMVISWIIICGIAVLFSIKFNFVNIVVTTFIFGLGDDFAIFISDAYIKFNRSGKKVVDSYNTGIFLSALSTIVGTGVLIFAEHPAMHSIASISVIGLIIIFLVSQTLQPILLEKLITDRTLKGRRPWSLLTLIATIVSFTYFLIGCILLFIFFLILLIIPAPKVKRQKAYRKVFQVFCLSLVYFNFGVKKNKINKHLKDFSKPRIIIANHSSFLDILIMVMQSPNLVILTNDWVYNSPFFGTQIRFAGYLQASKGVEANLDAIRKLVDQGCSIVIFPEGTRSVDGSIKRFHKGAFYLSEKLGIPIQPYLLHGFNYTMAKNDFMLKPGQLTVKYLELIEPGDQSWGVSYQERAKSLTKYFRKEFSALQNELETPKYFFSQIYSSYIYTSPLIENYVRVKYLLESKFYSEMLGYLNTSGRVYDLGCGLGYISFLIKLKNRNTSVIGLDYDEEKIEVAQNNCITKSVSDIEFRTEDIRKSELLPCSSILLGDVLHYFPNKDQKSLISKCIENLEIGGRLLIREGIKNEENHAKTEKTELYSTKILAFNKTDGDLDFIGQELIQWIVSEKNLTLISEKNSNKNSNALLIFEKRN